MMKKFLTVVLGSFVGAWLAMMFMTVVSVILSIALVAGFAKASSTISTMQDKSILMIDLSESLSEQVVEADMFTKTLNMGGEGNSLHALLAAIDAAKTNDKIKGIYLKCEGGSNGYATSYEFRKALVDFKTSGKPIYAYGYQAITQGDYYLASVADSIFLNPVGTVDLHGLSSTNMMYKNTLDKIGVEMQVVRVGTYKSAVEPYILTEISEANRQQQEHYMNSVWGTIVSGIAESRGISADTINALVDRICALRPAEFMLEQKLVDGICYKSELKAKLKKMAGLDKDDDLRLVSPSEIPVTPKKGDSSKAIAVLYAEGEIDPSTSMLGGDESGIFSDDVCEQIEELTENDDVKALVLRVNSPGGSAFGSEQIWKSLQEFKAAGKMLVVSMGDLAASGGYYISCGADHIFAEPVTITGSIGIFGLIPNFKGLAQDKVGLSFSPVMTNKNGNFGNLFEPFTEEQRAVMQEYVNSGYELFTKRCADGRKVSQDSIKQIAEGRVWEGKTAIQLGLVDEMGNLKDAIKYTADKLGCADDYVILEPAAPKSSMMKMIEKYMQVKYCNKMRGEMGFFYDAYEQVQRMLNRDKVLCIDESVDVKL